MRREKICPRCGRAFLGDQNRYCSVECAHSKDYGGKTFSENRDSDIARINNNWLNKKKPNKRPQDPSIQTFKNY